MSSGGVRMHLFVALGTAKLMRLGTAGDIAGVLHPYSVELGFQESREMRVLVELVFHLCDNSVLLFLLSRFLMCNGLTSLFYFMHKLEYENVFLAKHRTELLVAFCQNSMFSYSSWC